MRNVDYLGWELERQRAALQALLMGGGRTEDGEAPEEDDTVWKGKPPTGGKRRSPAGSGTARKRAVLRNAGRYAGNAGGEAGGPPAGAPGAWEMVREAGKRRPVGESGALETPGSAGEAGTGLPWASRRETGRRAQSPAREGTGPRAEPWGPSGGRSAEARETAADRTAAAETAAKAAGGRRAGERFAEEASAGGTDPFPEGRPGGGMTAGGVPALLRRDGAGTARLGGSGLTAAPGLGARLARSLPWGGGWESAALRAEEGARSLSRAVQRDARRYDGGFPFY